MVGSVQPSRACGIIRVEDGELRERVHGVKLQNTFGSIPFSASDGEKVAKPDEVNKLFPATRSEGNKSPCSAQSKINRESHEPREMNCRNRTHETQNLKPQIALMNAD